jgi:transposase
MIQMSDSFSKQPPEPEWAGFTAIDWGDGKHFWRLAPVGAPLEQGELENTPEAVDVWATDLYQRFGGRPIAVCVEQCRGALVYMLAKYPHLVLFPVHPTTAARYRETFCPSGAKADPSDAASLLDLLMRHRERLRPLQPDTAEARLLQRLTEQRRRLVDEKTRQKLRLTACLKLYFPQLLDWFDDVDSPLVGALLQRWPSLQELKRAHPGTLRKFFHEHNCRGEERIQQRIHAIYAATPAVEDAAVLEGEGMSACNWAAVLATLREQIAGLEQRIGQLVAVHPDSGLWASLPGAGAALLPRLLVAFGTRRDRYDSAYQMQCLSGIAPVTQASGKSQWVHFRYACPKFLRQTFHEFAYCSLRKSVWAQAYYQLQRSKNKSHHAAVRALAYKWIRILYRCWKDGKPYDEQVYLENLQKRNSPLRAGFASTTGPAWKVVSGLHKISENFS